MSPELHHKVSPDHLRRQAFLYVRQSTLRQVLENTESTKRQYALRDRAVSLGWMLDQIVVIDSDLGQSGADSDREGFKKLVAAVGIGQVGIVLGLEVSRLARSSVDWHRLLEICALTDTLILDEDGLYNPGHFNDRLLLGLKGTMSEAELHVLQARMQGGVRAKAGRGELEIGLPVGLVYTADGKVALDPDRQAQETIRLLFETFRRTGSAGAVVRSFREQGLPFPNRERSGPHQGELVWTPLRRSRALQVLKNPRYAGAFAFGRTRNRRMAGGRTKTSRLGRDEWHTLLLDAHPGYIAWSDYEANQRQLQENAQATGLDRRKSPPREGPALLQGLVICGRCGERMSIRYLIRGARPVPLYMCQKDKSELAVGSCQEVPGMALDAAIGELLVESVSPLALEVVLTVQQELATRAVEAERLRQQQVERAQYATELAQRRFLRVDPDNRLVADSLEADWNQKLRALVAAQTEYEQQREAGDLLLDEAKRTQILSLATDFPRLWADPSTPDRERKRMVRLILEDVTVSRREEILAHVRFRGGATRTLRLPIVDLRRTPADIVEEVGRLLDDHTDGQIAAILNQRGLRPHHGATAFTGKLVGNIRRKYGLVDRFTRFRRAGLLTLGEAADLLDVGAPTIKRWHRDGLLRGHIYNAKGQRLYEPPGPDAPEKHPGQRSYRPNPQPCIDSPAGGAV